METLHLESLVAVGGLILLRITGLLLFAPFVSSQSIPVGVKAGFALALAGLLYPSCAAAHWPTAGLNWTGVVAGEVAVGLVLGLSLQLTVEAAQLAGNLLGVQAGFSLITLLDPQTEADTPVLATLNGLLTVLIFLQLEVHHWLLRGLAASFAYLPPGTIVARAQAARQLLRAAGGIWLVGLQIAFPVVAATLLVDVTLGFLAKASPQMPVLLLGLPLKTSLGLTVLAGSLMLWPGIFARHFAAGIGLGEQLLRLSH